MSLDYRPMQHITARSPDNPAIVASENGITYRIRTNPTDGVREYLAYHIAQICGLPVPKFDILFDPSAAGPVFGVVWEADIIDSRNDERLAFLLSNQRFAKPMTMLCTFDHILCNDDRHAGNIMLRNQPLGASVVACDFARSFATEVVQDPSRLPHEACNSNRFYTFVFDHVAFDLGAMQWTLAQTRLLTLDGLRQLFGKAAELWPGHHLLCPLSDAVLERFHQSRPMRRELLTRTLLARYSNASKAKYAK